MSVPDREESEPEYVSADPVCSDICEENGDPGQADLLRKLAGQAGKLYAITTRDFNYNDQHFYFGETDDGRPRNVYLDRDEAERAVPLANARELKTINLYAFSLDDGDLAKGKPQEQVLDELVAIFGEAIARYEDDEHAPYDDPNEPPTFPADATEEQMIAAVRILDTMRFYQVIEVTYAS